MMNAFNILAGDVGGTKTLLALFTYNNNKLSLLQEERVMTKKYKDFEKLIKTFLRGKEKPEIICIGIAGPIMNGKVNITNIPLVLDQEQLSASLNGIPVYFINDLEATAYGLSQLQDGDFKIIHPGATVSKGNIAVIAPGTGLGEAAAWWDGEAHHPFATEGGHADFTVRNETDYELFNFLNDQFDHVSWERVVSGQGIVNIFGFLRLKKKIKIPKGLQEALMNDDPAKVISAHAAQIEICRETMELFFRYLATEAGNLALKTKATGGIFIGGGIVPKVLSLLDTRLFVKQFTNFGRLKYLLEAMPLKIMLNTNVAVIGAAAFAVSFKNNNS